MSMKKPLGSLITNGGDPEVANHWVLYIDVPPPVVHQPRSAVTTDVKVWTSKRDKQLGVATLHAAQALQDVKANLESSFRGSRIIL